MLLHLVACHGLLLLVASDCLHSSLRALSSLRSLARCARNTRGFDLIAFRVAFVGGVWPYLAVSGALSGVFGCMWPYLDVFGCIWPYLAVFGRIWPCLAVSGRVWWYLVVSGSIWRYSVVSRHVWEYRRFFKRFWNERCARASEASYAREALSRMPDSNRSFHIGVASPSNSCF